MLHNSSKEQLHFDPYSISLVGGRPAPEVERRKGPVQGHAVFGAVLDVMKHRTDTHGLVGTTWESTPAEIYEYIQDSHNHVLGQYFRNLFQILAYIDESAPLEQEEGEKRPPKTRYANLLRAQLSTDELSLLYFNCHGTTVDEGRFRELVVEYRLLEHMSVSYSTEPRIKNYSFEIDVLEYAERTADGVLTPGAFGKNRKIAEYIDDYNAHQLDLVHAHRGM